ncbi:MAG TPA: hypothetical protein VFF69_10695 [Phycisphaerales bacterium]|nr:hypothetical protein [Phycisphaerales bacterium]
MHFLKPLALLVLAGGSLACAGCFESWGQARFTRDVEATFLLPAGAGLAADTANGAIDIAEAQRDDVLVRAVVRATTQERADAVEIVADTGEPDWLEIRAVWPDGRGPSEGVSLMIEAPGGRPVRATTGNGELVLTGFSGGAHLSTSNGEVRATGHDGPVRADSSNGGITIVGAAGAVDAETSNGEVCVELADRSPGPVEIDSSNGGVTLVVGPGFAGKISADTSNGSVSLDDGGAGHPHALGGDRSSRVVQVGAGGPESRVETSNGAIRISIRK